MQRLQRDIAALGIEQPVELRPAGLHQLRHLVLGQLFLLHRLPDLPGDDLLDGDGAELLNQAFLREPIVDGRAQCGFFFRLAVIPASSLRSLDQDRWHRSLDPITDTTQ